MIVSTDGWEFDFKDAIDAFVFDEKDKNKPNFHGVPMKAVDLLVELTEAYLLVEIKEYDDVSEFQWADTSIDDALSKKRRDTYKWLKNYLKYKYRDSLLFRFAEEKVNKPIHYLCLVNFDSPLNTILKKDLKQELPIGLVNKRWKMKLADSCQVLNENDWNRVFPKWQVRKID